MRSDQTSAFDDEIRVAVYRFFVDMGRAPVPAEVAADLGTSAFDVEDAFRRLHEARVLVLAPGTPYIWMANPFSALPTPYEVLVHDKAYWGNCIWDALGIVALLGRSSGGTVRTRCPDCAEDLSVEIADGRLATSTGVVHYAVPAAHWWDDIGFN